MVQKIGPVKGASLSSIGQKQQFIFMDRRRRRGNPNWTNPLPQNSVQARASGFDEIVRNLGLPIDEYKTSTELKEWIRKNRNEKYVPPELLEAWQFIVDENGFTKRKQNISKRNVERQ